ncbi:MAG: hypothetical protein K0S07_993 [Chlamydiales bacterium]|jgi:hypothetical protein|nr:hypothetical protein [Chlamydiales bacterium]
MSYAPTIATSTSFGEANFNSSHFTFNSEEAKFNTSSSLVKISETTLTGYSTAQYIVTSITGYNIYLIQLNGVGVSGGGTTSFQIRFSTNGGASFLSTSNYVQTTLARGTTTTQSLLAQGSLIGTSNRGDAITGRIYLFNPASTTRRKAYYSECTYIASTGSNAPEPYITNSGYLASTGAINAISITGSGNFNRGKIALYGFAEF